MENFVIFLDKQTGGFSRHTTLEGIFEMCLDDYVNVVEILDREMVQREYKNASVEKMKELVEDVYEYEMLEPTDELVKEWEEYHNEKWSE